MIQNFLKKIKDIPREIWNDVFIILIILLTSLASFGLGRLSILYEEKGEFTVLNPEAAAPLTEGDRPEGLPETGEYVASKTGSKYHFPWCAGAQAIKEENKIFFNSKEEAEAAGYAPASNCKGL